MHITPEIEDACRAWLRAKRDYEIAATAQLASGGIDFTLFGQRELVNLHYATLAESVRAVYHSTSPLIVKRAIAELGGDRCGIWIRGRTSPPTVPPPAAGGE